MPCNARLTQRVAARAEYYEVTWVLEYNNLPVDDPAAPSWMSPRVIPGLRYYMLPGFAWQVWTGDVDGAGTTEDAEGVPRTVSMTWGEVCDVEVQCTGPPPTLIVLPPRLTHSISRRRWWCVLNIFPMPTHACRNTDGRLRMSGSRSYASNKHGDWAQ